MTDLWTAEMVAQIGSSPAHQAPVIVADDVVPVLPGLDVWDMWPLADRDGKTVQIFGGILWFALTAPQFDDPDARHAHARMRLLFHRFDQWHDCGNALPDGFSPGSREWSGSAIYDPSTANITLFFTATGWRGSPHAPYEQRLFQCTGKLDMQATLPCITQWSTPRESVACDDSIYLSTAHCDGSAGSIKAFRDPAYFRDPADGSHYLTFAASLKQSAHSHNGVIGVARAGDAQGDAWTLLPPLISGDGLTSELERPHILHQHGLYYLFWSTHARVFAPSGPAGPTALYGMVASHPLGPYAPLNGTGLVCANPAAEPLQAYAWWVTGALQLVSFIDFWGLAGAPAGTDRSHFGGTIAPVLHLVLDGDKTAIAP